MFPWIIEDRTVQLIIYEAENGDLEILVSGLARGTQGGERGPIRFIEVLWRRGLSQWAVF